MLVLCVFYNVRYKPTFFVISDYFNEGIWNQMDLIQDPSLRTRAATLPDLIHARWAKSTHKKYESAWDKWTHWRACYPESFIMPEG